MPICKHFLNEINKEGRGSKKKKKKKKICHRLGVGVGVPHQGGMGVGVPHQGGGPSTGVVA